jgi:hypothetical protein
MIVGLKILADFEVGDAEELVTELRKRNLLSLTLEQVKEKVKKEWNGTNWDDVVCDDDCIDYILTDLADGCFYWEFEEPLEVFKINIIDPEHPLTKDGKEPKVKVAFT